MKSSIYNIRDPEKSQSLPDSALIRYEVNKNTYLEVSQDNDMLEIRCAGGFVSYIQITPVAANVINVAVGDRSGKSGIDRRSVRAGG